jgi:hypothetical protein
MTTYLKAKWKHAFNNEPVFLYSELDGERWELRKVEVFPDGRIGFAGPGVEIGGTRLSEVPLPSFEQIATDPQFEPATISRAEFDAIWAKATAIER